jgi:hypothetical protein
MGSYFRGQPHRDIDLVLVLSCPDGAIVSEARHFRTSLSELGEAMGEQFDLTVFTEGEFATRPLRDMASLVQLYRRKPAHRHPAKSASIA